MVPSFLQKIFTEKEFVVFVAIIFTVFFLLARTLRFYTGSLISGGCRFRLLLLFIPIVLLIVVFSKSLLKKDMLFLLLSTFGVLACLDILLDSIKTDCRRRHNSRKNEREEDGRRREKREGSLKKKEKGRGKDGEDKNHDG